MEYVGPLALATLVGICGHSCVDADILEDSEVWTLKTSTFSSSNKEISKRSFQGSQKILEAIKSALLSGHEMANLRPPTARRCLAPFYACSVMSLLEVLFIHHLLIYLFAFGRHIDQC